MGKAHFSDHKIGIYAGALSLIEISVGSVLHAFHVPLTGTLLSLNQGFFLTYATRLSRAESGTAFLGMRISAITALLKSLSPAGKKLTPMFAISLQGWFFSLGCALFGVNILGVVFGSMLAATWGFVQPFLFAYVLFGSALGTAATERITAYFIKMTSDWTQVDPKQLGGVIIGLLLLKLTVAGCLAVQGWFGKIPRKIQHFLALAEQHSSKPQSIISNMPPTSVRSAIFRATKDIFKPAFIIPLVLTGIFFWFAEHELTPVIWAVLRPLAIGYLIFMCLHLMPWQKWFTKNPHKTISLMTAFGIVRHSENSPQKNQDHS